MYVLLFILKFGFSRKYGGAGKYFVTRYQFCDYAILCTKKQHNIKISEIGIAKIGITDSIFLISAVIFSVFLFITKGNLKIFTEVVSQQLFVSISEEILMRGIIFYLLSQLFRKKYYVVIVSAIIFGFALHTGGDFLSNLVYRFPAGIILAVLRIYTKKLYPPMVVHFMYNLWCIYL